MVTVLDSSDAEYFHLRKHFWTSGSISVVLNSGNFAPPPQETFGKQGVFGRGEEVLLASSGERSGMLKYPTMLWDRPTTKNYPAQNVSSATAEKPCSRSISTTPTSPLTASSLHKLLQPPGLLPTCQALCSFLRTSTFASS